MKYIVIGSGPSGANAALTLLEKGKEVLLLDVGYEETLHPLAKSQFDDLKAELANPYQYFLGHEMEGILFPDEGAVFDYPPSRNFRIDLKKDPYFASSSSSFSPVISHSRGGLGIAWGANTLAYADDDLRDFPLQYTDLEEHYLAVAKRMVISGPSEDDLSPHLHDSGFSNSPSLNLNQHDVFLFQAYRKIKNRGKNGKIMLGKARMAVDNRSDSPRKCAYTGRCLWGCGFQAIYNPNQTLDACRRYSQFQYRSSALVSHFETIEGRARAVYFYDIKTQKWLHETADYFLLAAGAISSGGIFLRTLQKDQTFHTADYRRNLSTKSLLDTQVVKIPYLFLKMISHKNDRRDFQFNKLIMAYLNRHIQEYPEYVHGEVLSLTNLVYHPLIESLPLGSRHSTKFFSLIKDALGAVTYFLPDRPYGSNGLSLEPDQSSLTGDRLKMTYQESESKQQLLRYISKETTRFLRKAGCWISRDHIMVGPSGSGIHYAGTIPMSKQADPLCVDKYGKAYRYQNLFVADGAAFPTLPSKSITFSLMAHATRVASYTAAL